MIFYDLIDYLYLHLSATEKLSFKLIEKWSDINPPFTDQLLKSLHNSRLYHLRIYLLPFITWFDHSILNELVAVSGSEDVQQLLHLFDSKITSYCDQPITSFPILTPTQLMIPLDDSEYTLLAMKFHPPSRSQATQGMIILQDVMDIKLTLRRKWEINSHDIQLVAVDAKLKIFYWMVPKCQVEVIESKLVPDWKSGIIMMSVLPANFCSFENHCEIPDGLFSSLNYMWQDDAEVNINKYLHTYKGIIADKQAI